MFGKPDDNRIECRDDTKSWAEEDVLEGHTDWVRDVSWAPNIGLSRSYIASAGQVRSLFIYTYAFISDSES
jgi:protein transport protein SEC13